MYTQRELLDVWSTIGEWRCSEVELQEWMGWKGEVGTKQGVQTNQSL